MRNLQQDQKKSSLDNTPRTLLSVWFRDGLLKSDGADMASFVRKAAGQWSCEIAGDRVVGTTRYIDIFIPNNDSDAAGFNLMFPHDDKNVSYKKY